MKSGIFQFTLFLFLGANPDQAQPQDPHYRRFFTGHPFFLPGNFIPHAPNPPGFVQCNTGYRITPKNVVAAAVKTRKYAWLPGIPYGKHSGSPEERYYGKVREFGIALVYQRFWRKGIYTAIHAMNTLQKYTDTGNTKLRSGYQLFVTCRRGYHIRLFRNCFSAKPSLAVTRWPVKTIVPASFSRPDNRRPNYFLPERPFISV